MMNTSPCSSHYSNASHGPTILHRVINPSMTVMNHHHCHFTSNGVDRNGQYWPMNNVCSSSHTLNSRTHCNYRMPEDVSPVHAPSKETMFVSSSVPCQHVIPSGEHSVFPLIYTHESSSRVRCDSLTCPTTEVNTQHALTSNTSVDNKMYITEFVPNNSHVNSIPVPVEETTSTRNSKMKNRIEKNKTRCFNCNTEKSPLWRKHPEHGKKLCNKCGLYLLRYQKDRPMHEEHLKAGRRKKIKKENMENRATEEGQREPKDIASNTMDDNHKNKRTKDQTDENESTLSKKVKTSSCSSEAETHSNSDPLWMHPPVRRHQR
ncbi:hypothetical protein C9374_004613 [Naegleria lovaniensis]|uniref:GATA-type domain-containing protein n=1 Tax=Naegleria lovaniensis TaxID=51637 RepID=A0AA88GQ76_NAELO|nr:uncharacterized protein C9374_004613 [Naegleria lovaniensis]KAG2383276.1 hypothetical protein C9374_004613 [Naegleria lovaniensis]